VPSHISCELNAVERARVTDEGLFDKVLGHMFVWFVGRCVGTSLLCPVRFSGREGYERVCFLVGGTQGRVILRQKQGNLLSMIG